MRTWSNRKLSDFYRGLRDGTLARTGATKTTEGVGEAASGVTAVEYGDGRHHITELSFTDLAIGDPGAGTNKALGALLYTFPDGAHAHLVTKARVSAQVNGSTATDTPVMGIGSVIASGSVAVLNGTATFMDYMTEVAMPDCDGTEKKYGPLGATAGVLSGISLNDNGDEKKVHLNFADGWHASAGDELTATGTVVLVWDLLIAD